MKEVVIELRVEGIDEATQSIGELEQSIQGVTQAANSTKIKIGDNIPQDINDASDSVDNFEKKLVSTRDVMKGSQATARLLSGSIQVASAAFATFGAKSEEVEKTLLKVQAASQLAGGIRDLARGFGGLGSAFNVARTAAASFNATLLANPYVLAAAAIIAVGTALFALSGGFSKAEDDTEDFNNEIENTNGIVDSAKQSLDNFNDSLFQLGVNQKKVGIEIDAAIEKLRLQGASFTQIAIKEKELEVQRTKDLESQKKLITQRVDDLNFEIKTSREILKIKKSINDADTQQTISQLNEAIENKREANKELQNIDLEQLKNKKELEIADLKIAEARQKDRDKEAEKEKKRLAEIKAAQDTALKEIQERYAKEIDDIKDFSNERENLLKKDLANEVISQEEFNDARLKLNLETNDKLKNQNENFIVTDAERKAIGADNELKLDETLSDDKLKVVGSYFDALQAINLDADGKEKLRLENLSKEEKRIFQQRLDNFNNEYILKKTALLREGNLKEGKLDLALQEAELENLRNRISLYELGSEDYFKLLEDIAQREIDINKKKEKIITDDGKKRQDEINSLLEAGLDIANQSVNAFSALADAQFAIKTKNLEKGSAAELIAAKKDFEVRKKLSIAGAVVSGIEGIVNVLTAKSTIPQPFDDIYRGIKVGLLVATTAANIAKISAQKFEGGSAGSSSAPQIPSINTAGGLQPTSFAAATFGSGVSQSQTFGAQQGSGGNVLRAYVSETDLTETQRRLRNIRSAGQL